MENREEDKLQNRKISAGSDRDSIQSAKIPVIEEKITIGKEVRETGKVHISKKVHEEEEMVNLPSIQEEVDIERIAVNKYVDAPPPAVRHEGDTTIISVLREVTVVEKKLELVEEVRITKRKTQSDTTQKVTLRKEEVRVDRTKDNHQQRDEA